MNHDIRDGDEVKAYWLASYPRSGNTLARITISQALLPPEEQDFVDRNFPSLDIEQTVADQQMHRPVHDCIVAPLTRDMGQSFAGRHGRVRFVKTHWRSPEVMDELPSIGGTYLVRHPLDVLLSGLNYMYVNADRIEVFRDYFKDKKPRPIEEIVERNEIIHYLDDFVYNRGFWPLQFGSGTWAENVRNWLAAAETRNIRVVTYSTFVNHRAEILKEITSAAGLDLTSEQISVGVVGGEEATRPDGKFFWRGGQDIKRKHIPPERIGRLEAEMFEYAGFTNIPAGLEL